MAKKTSSRTRAARQRRQRQRRQSRSTLIIAAMVVVAVVAIAVFVVANQPVEAHIPADLSSAYDGITRSYSREGYPQLGDIEAPVTLEEYASFACPGCQQFHEDSLEAVLERVRAGQVLFTYVPMQTGSVPNAQGASRAALCAGQQGMFWEMHDLLFDWQTRYGNTAFSQSRLLAGVEGLGMRESLFTGCFNSSAISETLNAALSEEVSTTPTLRVNGVTLEAGQALPSSERILQAIDDATPDGWGLPQPSAAAEADLERTPEPTDEADAATSAPTAQATATETEQADAPAEEPAVEAAEPAQATTEIASEATPAG